MKDNVHYLDYASTAPTVFWNSEERGNNAGFNSNAVYAYDAQEALETARSTIKSILNVDNGYVLFTRCATESIEWLASRFSIRCSDKSHDSVYNCAYHNYETMANLICTQLVNPVNGAIEEKDFDLVSHYKKYKDDFIGVDYTAAIGHIELPKNTSNIDAIWFSPHKYGCEKGIGVLWISDRLFKYLGGNKNPKNQYGLIHGTVNVYGAISAAYGMQIVDKWVNEDTAYYQYLQSKLMAQLDNAQLITNECKTTPAINLIHLEGINGNALQIWLAEQKIYVSVAASACAEDSGKYRVTRAMGIEDSVADQCIRVSFGVDTKEEDIKALANGIREFKALFN